MDRYQRKNLASATLQILSDGYYINARGERIFIMSAMEDCLAATRLLLPEELATIQAHLLAQPAAYSAMTCEVTTESSLAAASRLVTLHPESRLALLNFASAKHPGGGFLGGSQAQEESLARSSALYASLCACSGFYHFHKHLKSFFYSDRMIYSPACPVFRDDEGLLLDAPYYIDVISSPAPNAGVINSRNPDLRAEIRPVLVSRAMKVLSLAASMEASIIVLGAWGCGVFRNDPDMVAAVFADLLKPGAAFDRRFQQVIFAIYHAGNGSRTYEAFASRW